MINKTYKPLKLIIRERTPMSQSGWEQWGHKQRVHINKSRYVWRFFDSTKRLFPNGVPTEHLTTNQAIGLWLINNYNVSNGSTYGLQGFSHGKTKTHVAFSKTLCLITIHDAEKKSFTVSQTTNISRRGFRRKK